MNTSPKTLYLINYEGGYRIVKIKTKTKTAIQLYSARNNDWLFNFNEWVSYQQFDDICVGEIGVSSPSQYEVGDIWLYTTSDGGIESFEVLYKCGCYVRVSPIITLDNQMCLWVEFDKLDNIVIEKVSYLKTIFKIGPFIYRKRVQCL